MVNMSHAKPLSSITRQQTRGETKHRISLPLKSLQSYKKKWSKMESLQILNIQPMNYKLGKKLKKKNMLPKNPLPII